MNPYFVRLRKTPSPSISMIISSSDFSQRCGERPSPTPGGVPVLIMSPASSATMDERYAISSGIMKIMSRVFADCMTSPLSVSRMSSACGSAI